MTSRFSQCNGTDLLGAHMSTKGGLPTAWERATAIGANAVAIFSKNSSQWKAKPLTADDLVAFHSARAATGIGPLLVHASYLINLAATNPEFHHKAIHGMVDELNRAELLGATAVVLHPGAHMGAGETAGIDQIARSLDTIHSFTPDSPVLTVLETAAGQGTCLGCTFEQLGQIRRLVDAPGRVGVCVDTCHIFAAGYDIRTREGYERTIDELERHVGIEHVAAFHLNDSKKPLASRVDRHEHIGEGELGLDAFAFLLNDSRFAAIPKVLETPKPDPIETDIRNLSVLRSLMVPATPAVAAAV